MAQQTDHRMDVHRLARRAERLRNRALRRWLAAGLRRLLVRLGRWRAEAELRAMDERELRDLGLDRGGIAYSVRYGRADAE